MQKYNAAGVTIGNNVVVAAGAVVNKIISMIGIFVFIITLTSCNHKDVGDISVNITQQAEETKN